MALFSWLDLSLFCLLVSLFFYVFFKVTITQLHKVYFLFHFLMMLWPLCQFATDVTRNPNLQLMFVQLSFVSLSLLGGGWLLFTLFLNGFADNLGKVKIGLVFVPALLSAFGAICNPFHDFVFPLYNGYIDRKYGPLFWVTISILLVYFFTSLFLMSRTIRSPKTTPAVKSQVRVTLYGIFVLVSFSLSDLVLNVVLRNWLPIIPGLTSAGIFFADLFFIFAIIRYRVFDIVTIAHKDVIETIPYGILVLDENETIIEVNSALNRYVELNINDQFDMKEFLTAVHFDGDGAAFLSNYLDKKAICSQIEVVINRSEPIHTILQASPILLDEFTRIGRTITFQDVTQLRQLVNEMNQKNQLLHERNLSLLNTRDQLYQANNKLNEMAHTDSLTGCYNRRYLTQLLTDRVSDFRSNTPFSLILFDIDFFKSVNDRYGHLTGDEVIRSTVKAAEEELRSTDIISRYGGEEFLIYLPDTDHQTAQALAEQVRMAVKGNQIFVDQELSPISVTISLGVLPIETSSFTFNSLNPEEYITDLLASVDKALYRAKENGRNRMELAIGV